MEEALTDATGSWTPSVWWHCRVEGVDLNTKYCMYSVSIVYSVSVVYSVRIVYSVSIVCV